ncbi:MAG: HNH endonuclease [Phycisphaerales bacterium]|nr:MAG: HNH endonuclease [Phycisphaerales bacterium]
MAGRACYDCVYVRVDPEAWLRTLAAGRSLVPQCANHPQWRGQLRDVPGRPCENFCAKLDAPAGEGKRIALTDGHYTLVDAADYEALNQYNWRFYNGYAARQQGRKTIYMHRQIMDPPQGMMVDHVNRNKLDNRCANLRVCTRRENILNQAGKRTSRSRFKGVEYRKGRDKCVARIRFNGQRLWLGTFDDEVEAARAYDRAAVECFGEFAHLNFPEEWPPQRRAEVRRPKADDGGLRAEDGKRGDR